MNTILADRLFSDPRLRDLSDRLRDPCRALGLLGFIWHGTQNLGLAYADEAQLLNSLPSGMRRDRRLIDALLASGWLEACVVDGQSSAGNDAADTQNDNGANAETARSARGKSVVLYRVIGNDHHVQKRDTLSKSGKDGAEKRWGKRDGLAIPPPPAEASDYTSPSRAPLPPTSPALPREREIARVPANPDPPADPPTDSLAAYQLESVSVVDAKRVWDEWSEERTAKHGLPALLPSPRDLHAFKLVILWSGMDVAMASRIARAWVYCEDPKGYFKRQGWAPWLLAEERNFNEARAMLGKMLTKQSKARQNQQP